MENEKSFNIECKINVAITQSMIDDILADALDGGITYWCGEADVVGDYLGDYTSDQISRGGSIKLRDIEDENEEWVLNLDKFLAGYRKSIEKGYWSGDYERDYDSSVADVIVQLALFEEVVYG